MKQVVITISRQYGSGGRILAKRLAEELDVPYYDKEIIQKVSEQTGFTEEYIRQTEARPTGSFLFDLYNLTQVMPLPDQVFIAQSKIIKDAARQPCVVVGRCADYVLDDHRCCLRVFLQAPLEERVRRAREEYRVGAVHTESFVRQQDRYRASYYNHFVGRKWGDMGNYDLCVNTHVGLENALTVIRTAAQALDGGIR